MCAYVCGVWCMVCGVWFMVCGVCVCVCVCVCVYFFIPVRFGSLLTIISYLNVSNLLNTVFLYLSTNGSY